jgi:hypothetical protein
MSVLGEDKNFAKEAHAAREIGLIRLEQTSTSTE